MILGIIFGIIALIWSIFHAIDESASVWFMLLDSIFQPS